MYDRARNDAGDRQGDDGPERRCGVLLHPTALPGRWGIGDLGTSAYQWIDMLRASRQRLWQILPLGPTTVGGSPYSTLSSAAGNPYLISLDLLARQDLLEIPAPDDRDDDAAPVDFRQVHATKMPHLRTAHQRFQSDRSRNEAFQDFCDQHADWLDDYALFMALKDLHGGTSWNRWPTEIATRQSFAIRQARRDLREEFDFHRFTQYIFFSQWSALRDYANHHSVQIIGDIPFYVALDSSDVWSQPGNFSVDLKTGEAIQLGGVPPDYFSETGQLWHTPVYDWDHLRSTGYRWWIERFRHLLELVDIVRIDHFRGFVAFWQIPNGSSTAVEGEWVEAPGADLFQAVRRELGNLPIWAEDLGLITEDVHQLRDACGFPGMKVLQFAFDEAGTASPHLPNNFTSNCVCYTGTHDNNTTRGWWLEIGPDVRQRVVDYFGNPNEKDIHWYMIHAAIDSIANDVILPWQDVLGLGAQARFNVPGTTKGNWTWRFDPTSVDQTGLERLQQLTDTHGRAANA